MHHAAAPQVERLRLGLDALGDDLGAEVARHGDQPVEHRHLRACPA